MIEMKRKPFFRKILIAGVSALATASLAPTVCMADLTAAAMRAADFGTVAKIDSSKASATFGRKIVSDSFSLKKYGLDSSLRYLHGMYYEAEITKKCFGTNVDTGKKVSLKKGSDVIVLKPSAASKDEDCLVRTKQSQTLRVSNDNLKFTKYLTNSTSAYTKAQVEQWVNSHGITSPTNRMIFVSKYNQRLWVLKWNGRKWKVTDTQKASTGGQFSLGGCYGAGYPNDVYSYNHCQVFTYMGILASVGNERAISYSSKGGGNCIHPQSPLGRPTTHGCIGVSRKWFYDNLLNSKHDGIRNKFKNARVVLF